MLGAGCWFRVLGSGTVHATAVFMGVRHYRDLVCWQLSTQLKSDVYAITARVHVAKDLKFCDQIRDSARSAPRNIAEGFGRFRPADFARFLEFARASLAETQNHLDDGLELRYLTSEEYSAESRLADRASGATTKLLLYLRKRGRSG